MDPRARYNILKAAVLKCNDRQKIQAGLDFFFQTHENKACPSIPESSRKSLLVEVSGETINRDYIKYIQTGTWGTSANELLRIVS